MARITLAQPAVIVAHDHLAMGGMTSSHCPHRRQGVTLPDPPPYQSDGVKLSIQNLEAELEKVSPKMDFGKAKTRRGTEVVDETEFDAADLDYFNGPFLQYVARRMKAEVITEWTEAKFDCYYFSATLISEPPCPLLNRSTKPRHTSFSWTRSKFVTARNCWGSGVSAMRIMPTTSYGATTNHGILSNSKPLSGIFILVT